MNSSVMPSVAAIAPVKTPSKVSPMHARRVPMIQRVAAPQVKLSMRCNAATWLFAELDYDDVAFDPFDPVQDCSELAQGSAERDAPWL